MSKSPLPTDTIAQCIVLLHGHKVLLGNDLAELYGVEPRVLMQAVKRNSERFPEDFMFQLDAEEWAYLKEHLKSQNVISSWGGIRTRPYAFTEQGVAMLSSVLRSQRAVQVNKDKVRQSFRHSREGGNPGVCNIERRWIPARALRVRNDGGLG